MVEATSLFAFSSGIDSTLSSLFASSSGPVRSAPARSRVPRETPPERATKAPRHQDIQENEPSSAVSTTSSSSDEAETTTDALRPRKRRRVERDDIEGDYFAKLANEEAREDERRLVDQPQAPDVDPAEDSANDIGFGSDGEELPIPVHETLAISAEVQEDKLQRTVFLSNVSVTAIKSKTARKELLKHFEAASNSTKENANSPKVESIRFRSTAYTNGSGPKKAAFATKDLMEQTTKSTNAYLVFSTSKAAQIVAKRLNGTLILDRHVRVEHLGNPSGIDHKRCVFVGNLNFVDEETAAEEVDENNKPRRSKAKQPADAEEGLWRTFSKVGTVESVRVVRDKHTRVGKGFAYVQFADQNGVEAALLLNDKKFPPLLPRKLRVMRAKKVRERPQARQTSSKLPPRAGGTLRRHSNIPGRNTQGGRPHERPSTGKLIFEGHRASKPTSKDKEKWRRSKPGMNRSAKRGAAFKASGRKKNTNSK